jgi:hypothetical protein
MKPAWPWTKVSVGFLPLNINSKEIPINAPFSRDSSVVTELVMFLSAVGFKVVGLGARIVESDLTSYPSHL